jgi:hypothetical protein
MSIFKNTFKDEIQNQLKARQNAIKDRTSTSIKYLNSRNAWVRMSSSVNIVTPNGNPEGSSDLAKSYILQGGVQKSEGGLKSGIGDFNSAYSQNTPNNLINNQRGIRPMPGITSIDIKSKSAYGSLREVVVNFQCWDIKQLEDLELLYMRPGYTALVEWGWLPYLKNDNTIEYNITPYDIINKSSPKEQIWEDIFEKSLLSGGNYDATFGYVKNYSWSARPDGGYDCTTTIISIGEILESLKVNYSPLNTLSKSGTGLIFENVSEKVNEKYKKNILAGIFAELYEKVSDFNSGSDNGNSFSLKGYDFFIRTVDLKTPTDTEKDDLVGSGSEKQIYITLKGLIDLFNKYVLLKDKKSKTPVVKLSLQGRIYDLIPSTNNPEDYLLCLAHPLQLSVDPTICYIKNETWGNIPLPQSTVNVNEGEDLIKASNKDNYYPTLEKLNLLVSRNDEKELEKEVAKLAEGGESVLTEINKQSIDRFNKTLYTLLYVSAGSTLGISDGQIFESLGRNNTLYKIIQIDPTAEEKEKLKKAKQDLRRSQESAAKGGEYLKNKDAKNFFLQGDSSLELGVIANIYVNLQFLYNLSLNSNLESQDKKEKQEISIYDFLKSVMTGISDSIGNVNNFDIHIDPVNSNIARIIDINYVDEAKRKDVFDNIFTLEMHNLQSTVRSYKLESQIFQDQSTTVAIGAQVQGGALGTDSNTLVDFNRGVRDRIMPERIDPTINVTKSNADIINEQILNLTTNLQTIYTFLGDRSDFFSWSTGTAFDSNSASTYRGALRDLISYFKTLTKSDSKNRSIIPTKLSIEMDGIGGLVIGHLFKIPQNLLPKGYKGGDIGSKLGYIITSIGHTIINKDWKTNIDAQTIILDEPRGIDIKYSKLIVEAVVSGNIDKVAEINSKWKFNPPKSATLTPSSTAIIKAAKESINFSTTVFPETNNGNVGCAAAVSVIFTRAVGRNIQSPESLIYNTPNKSSELEYSTSSLYDDLSKDTKNWRKRKNWRDAKPGDIIVTARGNQAGHTGIVIDEIVIKNKKNYFKIISNTSKGFRGSAPGTIQENYDMDKWENIASRNPTKTASFEYIGSNKI